MANTTILSLGGSMIVDDSINVSFLRDFRNLVREMASGGQRFVIYCGGGRTARDYQKAARQVSKLSDEELDWIGIGATTLNCHLMKAIFADVAENEIISDPTKPISMKRPVAFASGWKPGWSTDYDAVLVAKQLKVKRLVNISNIDYVYTADPRMDKSAKPLSKISWGEFRKLVGDSWQPGLNSPFDPIAAKEAESIGLEVDVIGKDISNIKACILGKAFRGTKIY